MSQALKPQTDPHPAFTLCTDITLYEALSSNHVMFLKPSHIPVNFQMMCLHAPSTGDDITLQR